MNAIAAVAPGGLVTDNSDFFTGAQWVGGGLIAFAILLALGLGWGLRNEEGGFGLAAFPAGISFLVGATIFVTGLSGAESGGRVLEGRVQEVISDQYRITSIEASTNDGQRKPKSRETGLCAPVTPNSPEYVGVADGQQIRFKAGSTNCTSAHPKVTIIVTHTPGRALSADDLRKNNPTEEP